MTVTKHALKGRNNVRCSPRRGQHMPAQGNALVVLNKLSTPSGLVTMVKEIDELRHAEQPHRPPRACHVGEEDSSANCGNSRKPDNLIHHPDKPDGVSKAVGFVL